ncbi:MAG TPA: DJ-1/PfpI family protein [Gemmatimonadaceae bacterium]|nr:DJ-1/PfpI family protein [Gemmatimonadaceae bacterium]
MQLGLDGRRVALFVGSLENKAGVALQQELERAGARVHVLTDTAGGSPADYHGAVYAALILVDGPEGASEAGAAPILQLVREFMASDKPVAASGDAVRLVVQAGGAAGRRVAGDSTLRAALEGAGATVSQRRIEIDEALVTAASSVDPAEFASAVVQAFSERLDDRAVDEMSDLSFPASDPPAATPSTLGADQRKEAR